MILHKTNENCLQSNIFWKMIEEHHYRDEDSVKVLCEFFRFTFFV